ncbi:MAG: acyl-CoA dehydrogenase family protein [Actinomycetota bacterium]
MAAMRTLDEVVERVRDIARETTAAEADRVDSEFAWPEATMRAMQREGLGGLVVPVEHGGIGLGLRALTEVCEHLGYHSGSAGLTFGMHAVGSAVIGAKPTPEQVERYLEPICAGEHVTTLALSEPGTGANFWLPETSMTLDADGYVIDGVKSFITNGTFADSYVVSTVSEEEDAPLGHFSCVVVKDGTEGMEWDDGWRGIGMRGNSSRTAKLRSVRIDTQDLLGEPGDQIWYVFQVVAPYFLVAMAGTYLGIARRAVDEAIGSLKGRVFSHLGAGPAAMDVPQHKTGKLWTDVERTRRLAYWAAEEADRQGPMALPALCAAKAEVAGSCVSAVHTAITLMGGRAYRDGTVMDRLMRDALAADVMSPTTDLLLTWCGRALLEQPLLGE